MIKPRLHRLIAALLALTLLLGLFPAYAVQVDSAPLNTGYATRNGMVRVYLSSLGNPSRLDITISGSYSVNGDATLALQSGSTVRVDFDTATGMISLTRNGQTTAMGQSVAFRRHAIAGSNGLKIAQARKSSNLYPGDLYLTAQKSGSGYRLYTIVHVYIESYLNGVLPYELGNSAPSEALKAQAVAARTYTLNKMELRASSLYDVVDTTNDQVYYGDSGSTPACTAAVTATKGIVLMNNGKLTACYYTASNGGQTESAKNAWGSSGYPYLTVKDDPFDLMSRAATVRSATIYADYGNAGQKSALRTLLNSKASAALAAKGTSGSIVSITGVTPHTPKYAAPSRLYTKVDFDVVCQTPNGSVPLTLTTSIFTELETALGLGINGSANELWSVRQSGGNWVLEARRYGHGVGMSQRGAMQMASMGYTYDQILGFYYDDAARVQYNFTQTILSGVETGGKDTVTSTEPPADLEESTTCTAVVRLVSDSDRLLLRKTASANGEVLTTLMQSSLVNVLSQGETWTQVQYGSIIGYVQTSALTLRGTPPTNAEQPSTSLAGYATVRANGTLNLRASASAGASIVTTIPNGTILPVFSKTDAWAKVQYGLQVGYASTDFLAFSDRYPGTATSDTTEGSATVSIPGGSGTVNFRAEPSTSAKVLAQISHGTAVTVLRNDGSWCYALVKGQYGYIMSRYLSFSTKDAPQDEVSSPLNPGELEAVVQCVDAVAPLLSAADAHAAVLASIPRGESIVVIQRGADFCQVRYGSLQGYVATSLLRFPGDTQQELIRGYARVTTASGSLNLRLQAKAGSSILRTIPRNARVAVLSYGDSWCHVLYEDTIGYVMRAYLTMEASSSTPAEGTSYALVTTPSGTLNLRAVPSRNAQVLTTIAPGTRLTVLERGASWSKVQYGSLTGYVMTEFLIFEADAPTPTPAPTATPEATAAPVTETPTASEPTPTPVPSVQPTETPTASLPLAQVHTGNGYLNLRQRDSQFSAVIGQIPDGSSLTVLIYGSAWTQVTWQEKTGYVMTRYLLFSDDVPTAAPATATPTPVPSGAATTAARVSTPSGGLNLRETASVTAKILRVIPRNALVTVYARADGWAHVSYEQTRGYVQTQFLTDLLPSQPTATPTADASVSASAWVTTPSGGLNLRETASTTARVLTVIPRHAEVTLLQSGADWSRITYQQWTGYVQSKFLTATMPTTSAASTATPASSHAATPTPTPPQPSADNTTTEPTPTPTEAPTPTAEPASVLTGDGEILLYADPDENGEVVTTLPAETVLTLLRSGDTWCLVRWEARQLEGYCQTRYLTFLKGAMP